MGQEVVNSDVTTEGLKDPEPPASRKPMEYSYTRELLLSFADLEICKKRPESLDPVVWRDAPAADGADGGIAIPAVSSRGLVRRDREGEAFSKSPVDIPEWRKDSWRSGGSGAPLPQGPRRKPYDEETPGNAFSTSYPPRPAGNWGDNGHLRNTYERSGLQGQGSGRWDHRGGLADREREQGRPFQKWEGDEIVPVLPPDALRTEGLRPFGTSGPVVRPGWLPAERDGLLGSGGGLHRTYTGNFTTPSALRAGLDRQLSMGAPERQMSMGLQERQMNMGLPERPMSMGPLERQMSMGLPERQMSMGPLERQMSMGPPERQLSMGPPERQMSMGPPERQLSMGPPERQMSMGRVVPRHSEPYHPSRPLKGPAFPRREDTDFINDETFGSEESSTDDRSEQERKRRESFESMRKDHQRQLQKQQKLLTQKHEERLANPESNASRKHDESTLWDSALTSEGMSSSAPRSPEKNSPGSEEATSGGLISVPVPVPSTPRPAIPPGFAKVLPQMQTTQKASSTSEIPLEGDKMEKKNNSKQTGLQGESAAVLDEIVGDESSKVADKSAPVTHYSLDRPEVVDSSVSMAHSESVAELTPPIDAQDMLQPKRPGSRSGEENGEEWELRAAGISVVKNEEISTDDRKDNIFVAVDEYNKSQESLLDKWFGKPKSGKGCEGGGLLSHPVADESQNSTQKENAWSDADSRMSKFAQWFHPEADQSTMGEAVSSDIMSLFPKGDILNASSKMSRADTLAPQEVTQRANVPRNHGRVLPMPSGPSLEDIEKGLTASATGQEESITKDGSFLGAALSLKKLDIEPKADAMSGIFGEHSPVGKFKFQPVPPPRQSASRSSPVFLTCEDIEQSMLAEAGTGLEKGIPKSTRPSRAVVTSNRKDGQAANTVASHHLLSLLQKGTGAGKLSPGSSWASHTESLGTPAKAVVDGYYDGDDWGQSSVAQGMGGSSITTPSGDNPTLEALFGKAFMSELRSVEAPLSANTFASDFFGNNEGTQGLFGVHPVSRQLLGRMNSLPANNNFPKQWPGAIGPLSSMGWTESSVLGVNTHGHVTDVPVPMTEVNQYVAVNKEESHPVSSSGHRLWGNGVNPNSADGGLPTNTSVGKNDSFASGVENTSYVVGDATDSSVKGKGHFNRVHNSDLNMSAGFALNGDGESLSSGSFTSGQSRVLEDSTLALSQAKVLSSDEPLIGTSSSIDSSGPPQVFKEDGSIKRLVGDGTAAKFGLAEISAISREENTSAASLDSFLLASRELDRMEVLEDVLTGDKLGLGDDANSGNDRKMAEGLSDSLGFIGKPKDGNARTSTISMAGFPEQAHAGLARANSGSMRFKSNVGGMQPSSGFSTFQPVGTPLQHQQSIGTVYRSETSTSLPLQSRQQTSIPIHHHLQQNPNSATIAMFPQQFHPQPGLPQQQPLLGRTFSNGNSLEFPHAPFGHAPTTAPSRPLQAGHLHFPPSAHGHLSPPGAYHRMGHMGPNHNHFLPPAQMPQRGPIMSPLADSHLFMSEQSLHDPHGLGSKPGSQQGPSLFPLGGHPLQLGQGPLFHQPLPHNLRGQQNQFMPGPAPWGVPYAAELMRTASKGNELTGFANGNGGGSNSLDRFFGMELSRNVSGISNPGHMQLPSHGLDAESKMRFG